jgi:hypothetical protein
MDIAIVLERLNVKPEVLGLSVDGSEIYHWEGGDPQPSQEVLEAEWARYEAEGGQAKDEVNRKRRVAYAAEADPLFFQVQRGEVEQSVYDAKIAEIKARYPNPS